MLLRVNWNDAVRISDVYLGQLITQSKRVHSQRGILNRGISHVGQLPKELVIDACPFRLGKVDYEPKRTWGTLRNHPYTAGDHPQVLLRLERADHEPSGHLLLQELINRLRVSPS